MPLRGGRVNRANEEAYGASEILVKNSSGVGLAGARQLALNEPSRPLGPEPRRQQLVVVLRAARTKWGQ